MSTEDRRWFRIKRHDTSPPLEVTLAVDGEPVNLQGSTVRFVMVDAKSRQVVVDAPAQIDQVGNGADGSRGFVSYHWRDGDTATAGRFLVEWEVTFPDQKRRTFPNPGYDTVIVEGDLG